MIISKKVFINENTIKNYYLKKHRNAVRAEPMTLLTREFALRSKRVVDGFDARDIFHAATI